MQWGPICGASSCFRASRNGQGLVWPAHCGPFVTRCPQRLSYSWSCRNSKWNRLNRDYPWLGHRRTMAPSLSLSASATTLTAPPATVSDLNKPPPSHIAISHSAGSLSAAGHEFLSGLGKSMHVTDHSTSSGALVLGMDSGSHTSLAETVLGQLACRRFLASARIKIYWMSPEYGSKAADLPPETQFMLLELAPKGPYAVLLPLIDSGKFRATLRPPRKGDGAKNLRLRIESGDESVRANKWENALLCAAGHNPYDLVDSAVAAAAQISGTSKPRSAKKVPEFMKSFGWCTWDAFYSQVSAQGIQHGLDALRKGGVAPKLLIIDDGWQSTELDEALRPISETGAARSENKVLVAASKGLAFSGGSPMAQLANQAAVQENGAADSGEPDAPIRVSEHGSVKGAWERFKGYLAGLVAALITTLYTYLVEHAPTGSWRISWFSKLSEDKLRKTILAFYAQTSDHVKRLTSPLANGKFSSTSAGPDTPWGRPEALRTVVTDLKERYHLKYVFCWHSLYGYWAGVDPTSPEMQQYKPSLVWPKPTGGVTDVDPPFAWNCQVVAGAGVVEDVQQLYSDMHSYLADCGVDGVKVDCQSTLDMIGSSLGGGSAYSAKFHGVLEDSIRQHFPGNALINCMCHSTNDLYRMTDTALARSSDDFWPRDPASHTTHVAINAGNSVFMAALVQPDWDMFQSQHPAALLHASARLVSGGPVYVSDRPGKHNMELLKRMVLPDGNVLLCTQPGRPTLDCLFADSMRDKETLLKVWNTNRGGSGVVGIFNVQGSHWSRRNRMFVMHDSRPQQLTTLVSPSDIMAFGGEDPSARFVLYSDAQKMAWVTELREGVKISLKRAESDVVTVVPLRELKGLSVAPIGLVNMLNTGAAVQSFVCEPFTRGTASCSIIVYGCGSLAVYSTAAPSSCTVEGMNVKAAYSAESKLITVPVPQTSDLEATVQISFGL